MEPSSLLSDPSHQVLHCPKAGKRSFDSPPQLGSQSLEDWKLERSAPTKGNLRRLLPLSPKPRLLPKRDSAPNRGGIARSGPRPNCKVRGTQERRGAARCLSSASSSSSTYRRRRAATTGARRGSGHPAAPPWRDPGGSAAAAAAAATTLPAEEKRRRDPSNSPAGRCTEAGGGVRGSTFADDGQAV